MMHALPPCVCMYVCMYVRMYVCMYVCMSVCLSVCLYVCMYACMHVRMYLCVCVCVRMCVRVCLYVYMCERVSLRVRVYVHEYWTNRLAGLACAFSGSGHQTHHMQPVPCFFRECKRASSSQRCLQTLRRARGGRPMVTSRPARATAVP